MATARKKFSYMAKLAEQAERYEEMAEFMEKLAGALPPGEDLTPEERSLLSVAYKNVLGAGCASLRIISFTGEEAAASFRGDVVRAYCARIEAELSAFCDRILRLLDARLAVDPSFASAARPGATVFYLKMKGDCHRHLAGLKTTGSGHEGAAEAAIAAYKAAQGIASRFLAADHQLRLATELSLSVFCYELLCSSEERARSLAKQAMDDAAELYSLEEETYRDSTKSVQLPSDDNLVSWSFIDDIDDGYLIR